MSWLFGKRTNVTTSADKIAAFQSTTCDFGTPLPLVFGTAKRGPNLINYQDFYAKEIKTTQKTGKRSSSTQIDYKYHAYIELALCEGTIDGIGRLWIGDKTYESLAAFNAADDNQGAPLSLNDGSVSSPTAYMASHHPDIAVGYNNMAFLYGYVYLGMNNASIPSYAVEIMGLLRNSGDGTDANPATVISYLLTLLGYGNNIDNTSFTEYWQYCSEADLLISTPQDAFTSQKKCQEVIKELLTLTNTYMFWSVDKFKFVPRDTMPRGEWTPRAIGSGPHLTPDDMAVQSDGACVLYERKDSSEIYNRFGVIFTSRANGYEAETVFYEDTNDIATNGIKSAPDLDAKWLHTVERAVTVAEMQARINRTENIKYTFKLSWAFAYLEPGDLVTLTDPVIGLNQQLVMIETVTEQADETLLVTAIRREDTTAATYDTGTDDYNIIDNSNDPDDTNTPIIFEPPAELATSPNMEIWIALQGQTSDWGGCSVYGSTRDGNYELAGTHNRNSNYGKLLTALTADGTSVDVEFSNVGSVELSAGSAQDAADGLTDIYIDGEYCAYTDATLIGTNQYRLTLVRGKYGSTAAAHAIDADFAMMDGNLFSLILPKNAATKTVFLKFPAFNVVGKKAQDLADLDYYTYTLADKGYVDEELEGYVDKTSGDYLKGASVSGHVLTLVAGDGSEVEFTDTTYTDFVGSGSSAAHGLVPKPPTTAGTTKYLREDGSWTVPPDTVPTITEGSTNGTISVDGTDVAVHGLGSNAYDSTSYLPLAGGIMTGNISISNSNPVLSTKNSSITRNTAPSADVAHIPIQGLDSANNRLWGIYNRYYTDKTNRIDLVAYNGTTTNYNWTGIGAGFDGSGAAFTYAPTPDTSSNDTNIATTAFVKNQGYITSSGTATNVSGIVDIANGGTGQTTRLNALKALTNEDVSTNANYFLTITSSWGKGGYTSVADAKTVLGLGSNAYSSTSYLPLAGGTMTGAIFVSGYLVAGSGNSTYVRLTGGSNGSNGAGLILYGKSNSNAGRFDLTANNGTSSVTLIGKHDGSLTWGGQPIQTSSDKRLKQDFSDIPADVLETWGKIEWQQFKYKADAERKGKNCRWHVGLVAQDVVEVGEENNVDLLKYGILCHDVAEAVEEEKDENGNVIREAQDAVDLWTVRYEEALAMEVAYQRRRADRLEERIARLEQLIEGSE